MSARVAILTDQPGWHGRELQRAFRAHGVQTAFASLSDCRLDLEGTRAHVRVPGFETHLPDAVFVRSIEAGTFEQVTLRLSVLHALRDLGVPVYKLLGGRDAAGPGSRRRAARATAACRRCPPGSPNARALRAAS